MTDELAMKYLGVPVLKTEGESCAFDPGCPPRVKKIKSRKKLRKRIAELEAALKPFDQYDESRCYLVGGFVDVKVKLADLRAARAAMEKKND